MRTSMGCGPDCVDGCSVSPSVGCGAPDGSAATCTTAPRSGSPIAGGNERPLLMWHATQLSAMNFGPSWPVCAAKAGLLGSECAPLPKSVWCSRRPSTNSWPLCGAMLPAICLKRCSGSLEY